MTRVVNFNAKYVEYRFDLRWVLDYVSGKTIRGIWSRPPVRKEDDWNYQKLEGLFMARIEARCRISREIKTIVECPKDIFIGFKWIGATPLPVNPSALPPHLRDIKFAPSIQGIQIHTPDEIISAYLSKKIVREPNPDKKVNLSCWRY